MLGYTSALTPAVLAGLLQFIPVVGPSIVVLALAGDELVVGDVDGAILVATLGLVLVGFLPDALIRPRLAYTARMPGRLSLLGFTGGVFTIELVGFIAGPFVVGLLRDAGHLLSPEMGVGSTETA
jgi:predicted PurR-regulated permease PerM